MSAVWAELSEWAVSACAEAGHYSAILSRNPSTSSRMFGEKNFGKSVDDGERDSGGMCCKAFLQDRRHTNHRSNGAGKKRNWTSKQRKLFMSVAYCVVRRTVWASAGFVSIDAVIKEVRRDRYQMAEASVTVTSLVRPRWQPSVLMPWIRVSHPSLTQRLMLIWTTGNLAEV